MGGRIEEEKGGKEERDWRLMFWNVAGLGNKRTRIFGRD